MLDKNKKIAQEVIKDFQRRADERKAFETLWRLNINFLMGNQYCDVGYGGNIEERDRQFFWQEREIFNHIAPIFDIRFAKLIQIKRELSVLPATSDERDKQTAKVLKKILNSVESKLDIQNIINEGIKWSEVCGTSFYKISWNNEKGQVVGMDDKGEKIYSGEVDISVCNPFEIYPDSCTCEDIRECQSIIHARAFTRDQVKSMYGVDVEGKSVNIFSLAQVSAGLGGLGFNGASTKVVERSKDDSVIVIERYVRPNKDYPNGRLTIVAGECLVYDDDLPFACGEDGQRDLPFIRQVSIPQPACFWGTSVIERMIPVQRAYNAVKNRKHEFLNRLSLGVLSVEDGSVDLDNLEDEGLCPGKILVYRQGANQPKYLEEEALPDSFDDEETKLLDEFYRIGGVSETMGTDYASSNISGVTLELMINQDEIRLNSAFESIRSATKKLAKFILRLYKQFALFPRIAKIVGENGEIELFYFSSNDISSDDVVIENQSEGAMTITQRREMIFRLLDSGVLSDENGNISNRTKAKVVEMLGMGLWENAQDTRELHIKKADNENLKMKDKVDVKVCEIDEHGLHIQEHIAFMLGKDFQSAQEKDNQIEARFLAHIREHKKYLKEE